MPRHKNEYYKTDEEFIFALADALHEEYKAIIDDLPARPRERNACPLERLHAHLRHVEAHRQPVLDDPQLADLALEIGGQRLEGILADLTPPTAPTTADAVDISGGAAVTQKWAAEIGADGYSRNAIDALALTKNLMGKGTALV